MSIIANSPRPGEPKRQSGSRLSWIFFLLILARPLWGILRSLVPPQVTNAQLGMLLAGAIGLAVVATIASHVVSRRSSSPVWPSSPATIRPRGPMPMPQRPLTSYRAKPPAFEPIITGNVVVAGVITAAAIGVGILLIALA